MRWLGISSGGGESAILNAMNASIRESGVGDAASFSVAGCFCLVADQVLLIKRQRGKTSPLQWSIPAGKLEFDEEASAAASRELFEETGICVDEADMVPLVDQVVSSEASSFRFYTFVCKLPIKPVLILSASEIAKAEWVPRRNVRKRHAISFFWDGIYELNHWVSTASVPLRLLPTPPATSARGWGADF